MLAVVISVMSAWSEVNSWLTRPVLFLLLNIMIGTIAITSGLYYGSPPSWSDTDSTITGSAILQQQKKKQPSKKSAASSPSSSSTDLFEDGGIEKSAATATATATATASASVSGLEQGPVGGFDDENYKMAVEDEEQENNKEESRKTVVGGVDEEIVAAEREREREDDVDVDVDVDVDHYPPPSMDEIFRRIQEGKFQSNSSSNMLGRSKSDKKQGTILIMSAEEKKKDKYPKTSTTTVQLKRSASDETASGSRNNSEIADEEEEEAVDAKADDFINKFRQQLQLQRMESLMMAAAN